jgi:hypothetical protein
MKWIYKCILANGIKMIGLLSLLVQQSKQACTKNPLRDIYLSNEWLLINTSLVKVDSPEEYGWITNSSVGKVTDFKSQTPAADNWCSNSDEVLGSVSEFCCSTRNVNDIAVQYMGKYVLGTLSKQAEVVSGQSLFLQQDFMAHCKLVQNAN